MSDAEFVGFFQRFNASKEGWPIDLEISAETGLLKISDLDPPNAQLHLGRTTRVELYPNGVRGRLDHLWKEYLVDEVDLSPNDLVVDIGANVGEFSLAAQRFGARTFSIEPDPLEFQALRANCNPSKILRCALWSHSGELSFYSKNESGDSSLFETADFSEQIKVPAKTLDEVYEQHLGSVPIKILKIEAEGAEPEIIAAGAKTLAATEYVTVDVGPERGIAQENTVAPVLKALSEHGFQLRKFGNVRFVMLLSR